MRKRKWMAAILAGTLLAALLSGCSKTPVEKPEEETKPELHTTSEEIHVALSYEELLESFREDEYVEDAVMADAETPRMETRATATNGAVKYSGVESADEAAYTGTNVQVEGFDEGDYVKTDGQYLYILSDYDLKIVKADGENTAIVSQTEVLEKVGKDNYLSQQAQGMFIHANTAAVIFDESGYNEAEDRYITRCHIKLYDLTERTAPVLVADYSQDGSYQASRLTDGVVYLVSTDYRYIWNKDELDACIPCVYREGKEERISPDRIYICPNSSHSYSVVTSVDVEARQQVDRYAFTGSSDTVYMDDTGLYLLRNYEDTLSSDAYKEDQYTVQACREQSTTEIKRLALSKGKMSLDATANVNGHVSEQYAVDVYQGVLRVATSSRSWAYKKYVDEKHGWTNYAEESSERGNNLYLLNEKLEQVGAVENFAPDESIHSVRFMGELAYVVTFRQTDPLFTIDLRDPAKPVILDSLKISGVSEYLHLYEEGKLFGLGVDEDWALKAVMFDVADPEKIAVSCTLDLSEYDYSEALENPRAILISRENNVLAFPSEDAYIVLGYENGKLVLRGTAQTNGYTDHSRGVIIDEMLYVCGGTGVTVLELHSLEQVQSLSFAVG